MIQVDHARLAELVAQAQEESRLPAQLVDMLYIIARAVGSRYGGRPHEGAEQEFMVYVLVMFERIDTTKNIFYFLNRAALNRLRDYWVEDNRQHGKLRKRVRRK